MLQQQESCLGEDEVFRVEGNKMATSRGGKEAGWRPGLLCWVSIHRPGQIVTPEKSDTTSSIYFCACDS